MIVFTSLASQHHYEANTKVFSHFTDEKDEIQKGGHSISPRGSQLVLGLRLNSWHPAVEPVFMTSLPQSTAPLLADLWVTKLSCIAPHHLALHYLLVPPSDL